MGIRHERCRMSTTVALRGHSNRVAGCPLSGVKQTSLRQAAHDPKRTSADQHLRPVVCDFSHTD